MTHPDAPVASAPPPRGGRSMLGVVLMLAGFFCYGVSDVGAKLLTAELPPLQVVWLRQLGLLSVGLWILARRGLPVLRTQRPVLQISRGLVAALSSTCFIFAVAHVPLADAVAVSFVAPFIVTVLAALVLREKVGIRRWAAITVGFIGMLIVVRPGLGVFHPSMFLVVAAASFFAIRQILSRLLGPVDATSTTIVYTAVASVLLLTLPVALVWQWPQDWQTVALIAFMATAAGLGEVLVIRALELAQAVILAPLHYSLIVWSTLLGWLVFSQLPDRWTLTGAAIIVASGIYTVHRERLAARQAR